MSITPLKKQSYNLRMQKSVSIVDVLRQAQIHLHGHGHSGTATDNQEGNHLLAERLLSRLTIVFFFFTILLVQRTPQEAFRTYAFLASSTPPKICGGKLARAPQLNQISGTYCLHQDTSDLVGVSI
jgi:hypothetical protein